MKTTIPKAAVYEYKRSDSYNINDIVIIRYFDRIFNKELTTVLRVIGEPGHQIQIKQGEIFVNKKQFNLPNTALLNYKLFLPPTSDSQFLENNNDIKESYLPESYILSFKTLIELTKKNYIDSFKRVYFNSLEKQNAVIGSERYNWNMDNFGPLRIKTQHVEISNREKEFYYGNKMTEKFYFLIADNFYESIDSRIIGLIPTSKILGKVISVKADAEKKEMDVGIDSSVSN